MGIRQYLNTYTVIIFTQKLANGAKLFETYRKIDGFNRWVIDYSSTSAYHICPFDGNFRECESCEGYNDINGVYCLSKQKVVSTHELSRRIVLYLESGGKLEYY